MKYLIDFFPNPTFYFNSRKLVIFHDQKLLYKSSLHCLLSQHPYNDIPSTNKPSWSIIVHWSNSDRFLHEPAQREESFDREYPPRWEGKLLVRIVDPLAIVFIFSLPFFLPSLHTSHIADVIILGRDRWKKTNTSRFKIFYSWRLHFACAATAEINCSPVACRDRRVACSSITIDFAWEHYEEAEKALVGGVLLPPTISKISILFQPTSFRPCLPF